MTSVPSARSGIASRSREARRDVPVSRVRPPHGLEEARRSRLQRQMHLLAHGIAVRECLDDRLSEVLGVRAREPDPLDALHGVAGAQQLTELGAKRRSQVASPRVDVLAEQRDLLDAVARQRLDLGDDLPRAATLLLASNRRNDAVGALRVAAHRNLYPGAEAALAVHRKRRREGVVGAEPPARNRVSARLDPLAEMRDRARPERDVDEGIELEDPLPLGLRVAAADRDYEIRVAAASARQPPRGTPRASYRASRGSCRC